MQALIKPEIQKMLRKLTKEEYTTLEASIVRDGLLSPIVFGTIKDTNDSFIIDGHNRWEICNKHKMSHKKEFITFDSMDDVKIWVIDNQLGKRNINDYERAKLIMQFEEIIAKQAKAREIAGVKVDPRETFPQGRTRDILGEKAKVSGKTIDKVKKIEAKATPEQKEQLSANKTTINKVYKAIKSEEKQVERKAKMVEVSKTYVTDKNIKIIIGDCESLITEKNKGVVDVIITDPPYPYEFIECWDKLSKVADHVLKPGGLCIAMSGQLYLPEVMERMSKHLVYYWTLGLLGFGPKQIVHPVNVQCGWKPILVYQKAPKKKSSYAIYDMIETAERPEKSDHEWQQSLSIYETLVERFSEPGQVVLDPFAGAGTTLLACKNLKRKCIGVELNKDMETVIKGRLI